MIRKLLYLICVLFLGLFGFINSSYAQETTSSMSGIVKDKSGPIPGVTITAVHVPTGTKYLTSTRSDGRFNLSGLKVGGPYTLTSSYIGYKTESQDNITLSLGENYNANFAMVETSVQLKTIVVKGGQNKTFNTNHTGSSDIVTRTQIERLPTLNRNLSDYTKLTPYGNGGQANTFGGRNNLYNNITVNGASFNNTFGLSGTIGGQTGANPISVDAVDQIQVNLSPYDVTQGSFTGAGVNTLTKAGTNNVYATLYGYYQAPSLVGTKVGNDIALTTQQFNYNMEGFSIGLPIIKDKLFLFLNAERERRSFPATSFVALRPGLTAGGSVSSAPASTLDSLKSFLISKYNYDPGTYENYNRLFYRDNITSRIDINLGPKNNLNVNLFYLRSYKDIAPSNSGSLNGGRQPSLTTLPFSGAGYRINNDLYSGIIEWNSRFSNSVSNKFQTGFTAMRDYRASLGSGIFPEVDILTGAGKPELTSFGFEPFTAFNKLNTNIFQLNDYVKVYVGKHEITLGTQNQFQSYENGFAPNYYGSYVFNTVADFYNSANNGVDNAFRYTLRYPALSTDFPIAKLKNAQLGFLIQDKINIDPRFTMTVGLRADVDIFTNTFDVNPAVPNLTFRNGVHINTGKGPGNAVLLSPRVGFNWDVNGDHSIQVRGGSGIFSGPPPQVWISNQASNNGVQFGSFTTTKSGSAGIGYPFSPDVNKYRPTPSSNLLPTSYNLAVTSPNFHFPQVWRTTLGIDFKLPGSIVATAEGFYTQDINGVYFDNVQIPNGSPLPGVDNRVRYPKFKIYDGGGKASTTTLTNPNISDAIVLRNTQKGYSYAASFKLERNVKNLYTALIYTYSDSRSVNDGGSIAQSSWAGRQVSGDVNAEDLGYSSYRVPNRLLGIASYRFEYAKAFASSFGLTYELLPGNTYTYTYSGDLNNDGVSGNDIWFVPAQQSDINLVDVKSGTTVTYAAQDQWNDLNNYINQDKYLSTRRGKYAERNGLIAPYYYQVNLNFTQDFFFTQHNGKKHTLRFTADILNFQNLLNKNWGTQESAVNTSSIIAFKGLDGTGKPTFSVNKQADGTPYFKTFTHNTGSLWSAQLGLRYIFQ